jgi:hypothetical protein
MTTPDSSKTSKVIGFTMPVTILPNLPTACVILMSLLFEFVNKIKAHQSDLTNMSNADQQQLFDQLWKDITGTYYQDMANVMKLDKMMPNQPDQSKSSTSNNVQSDNIQPDDVRLSIPEGKITI